MKRRNGEQENLFVLDPGIPKKRSNDRPSLDILQKHRPDLLKATNTELFVLNQIKFWFIEGHEMPEEWQDFEFYNTNGFYISRWTRSLWERHLLDRDKIRNGKSWAWRYKISELGDRLLAEVGLADSKYYGDTTGLDFEHPKKGVQR